MSDRGGSSFLDRYTRTSDAREIDLPGEDLTEGRSFGYLRGARDFARMLELRRRDGNILAVGYNHIERIAFDPSEGITIFLGASKQIRIRGRHLNSETQGKTRLFNALARQRVPWIAEVEDTVALQIADESQMPVIDAIEW